MKISKEHAEERVLHVLGNTLNIVEAKNKRSKLCLPAQSTWDAFQRGYMKAVEDFNNSILKAK